MLYKAKVVTYRSLCSIVYEQDVYRHQGRGVRLRRQKIGCTTIAALHRSDLTSVCLASQPRSTTASPERCRLICCMCSDQQADRTRGEVCRKLHKPPPWHPRHRILISFRKDQAKRCNSRRAEVQSRHGKRHVRHARLALQCSSRWRNCDLTSQCSPVKGLSLSIIASIHLLFPRSINSHQRHRYL